MKAPGHRIPQRSGAQSFWLRTIVLLLVISVLLRTTINNVAPALPVIQQDLNLSSTVAGLTSTLPLLCFGVFAFMTPGLLRRFGTELTVALLLIFLVVGAMIRCSPTIGGLLGGTVVIGIGAAIGNAVVPVAIRESYPRRATFYMGLFSAALSVGASLGAGVTMPLIGAGMAWHVAINVWIVANVLVLIWWLIAWKASNGLEHPAVLRRDPKNGHQRSISEVIRKPLAVLTCAHMGVQSAMFFALMTWGPSWLQTQGLSANASGLVFSIFSLASLPGSVFGARLIESRAWRPAMLTFAAIFVPSIALMCFNGLGSPMLLWTATLVGGACQGALLTLSLTFITTYRDLAAIPAVSALANGVGYLIASIWPIGLGWAGERIGVLSPIIWSVALMPVGTTVIAFAIKRRRHTEEAKLAKQ